MLKKSITFEDFNGDTVTEVHHFHLSKADLIELEMSYPEGLAATIQKIVDSEDGHAIVREFKKLLISAYGVQSEDGKRFIKNETLREEFLQSEAYSTLFMDLIVNADAAIEFINGIVPKGLEQDLKRLTEPKEKDPGKPNLTNMYKPRVLTKTEAVNMGSEELKHLLATGEAVIGD